MSTTTRYDDALELYSDAPRLPRLGRLLSSLRDDVGRHRRRFRGFQALPSS